MPHAVANVQSNHATHAQVQRMHAQSVTWDMDLKSGSLNVFVPSNQNCCWLPLDARARVYVRFGAMSDDLVAGLAAVALVLGAVCLAWPTTRAIPYILCGLVK